MRTLTDCEAFYARARIDARNAYLGRHFKEKNGWLCWRDDELPWRFRDARSAATEPPFNNATDALDAVQQSLADFCASHNPNFDRARFLAACEPSTSKE